MQSPRTAANSFRKAVSAGAFAEAEQLLESYRHDVEAAWNAATSSLFTLLTRLRSPYAAS